MLNNENYIHDKLIKLRHRLKEIECNDCEVGIIISDIFATMRWTTP